MNQLLAMRVFTCVVDLGSFSLAARQLGMSAPAVTRSVTMLETHLNMRLLNRTTRRLSLTDLGKEYLDGCRTILEKLEEMESNLAQTTRDPRGTLRIAAPMTFAASGLGALLASYRALQPRVDFDVTTYDSQVNIFDGAFDVCFSDDRRFASATLVSRTLTSIVDVAVASPAYLALHGSPHSPASLDGHGLLTVSDGRSRTCEFSGASGVYRVNTASTLTATSGTLVRIAALNGMGIALLPYPFVADDLEDGTLLPVLETFEVNGGPRQISILYSGRTNLSMKVRSFIDFTVRQYPSPDRQVARGRMPDMQGQR